ncbi:type VI secretion system Vgr family protein [Pseudomonas citrulli]|uniref:Type VI secretion system tip protein TssI/VgrG n=1 Tax=Pseudomonas citrulli TaxID=3064347 RepID=A0ABT9C3V9_9PSED|nr:type VI secretion system tip protein TssI/VgrG [Pseudomonas sp. K18]MDO7899468.1 type VI secretion system tip protein TssI/VgrG [Pseudomonas sp. K18]
MRNDMESPFSLTFTQSDLQLQVLRFSGREALNQPYRFDLELISLAPPMNPDTLLGQPAFLRLDSESGIHGIVHGISLSVRAPHRIGYRVTLVPHLQRLDQGPRRRVFSQLSAVQMLQRLLAEHALPADSYRFELPHGQYPRRPFCIQYEESDLALLQRLCEEEGIHYHFEHAPGGHVLVFAEDPQSFPPSPVQLPLRPGASTEPAMERLYLRHRPMTPGAPDGFNDRAEGQTEAGAANHAFGHPGPERLRSDPLMAHRHQASRRHLERLRCRQREIHGQSAHPGLRCGHLVQIDEHPVSTFNDQWLIVDVQHRGRQFSILEPNLPATPSATDYRNRFTAIPWSTVFRPALRHPKPRIPGYHLAHVPGHAGQPARADEQGQVSVSLWTPDQAAIALPVSRLSLQVPPVLVAGSQVLVSFLDGDPDRPVLCPGAFDAGPGPATAPPRSPQGACGSGLLLDWLLNPPDLSP